MQKFFSALAGVTFIVTSLMTVVMPSAVFAHMAAGSDAEVGRYLVDVGWSPDPLVAGEPAALAFNLGDKGTNAAIDFGSVWVRISLGDKITFAGNLRSYGRNATFTQTFPEAGEYELTARFLAEDGATLAEKTFPVTIVSADAEEDKKGETPGQSFPAAFVLAILLIILELAIHPRWAKKA